MPKTKEPKKKDFERRREAQENNPGHIKLVEKDAKRGTYRNVYLLKDRLFVTTVAAKAGKGIVGYGAERNRGDRMKVFKHPKTGKLVRADVSVIRENEFYFLEAKKRAKSHKRSKAQRKARKKQFRIRNRGKHAR